jgi:nucleotide-binding universal stress UspA family protein
VDLVVMTTHGHGGVERAWLGSVADQLIRSLNVPVLALRASERGSLTETVPSVPEILVPLDGSPLGEAVLEYAAAMARLWGTGLSLVRIVQPVFLSTDPALPFPSAYDQELTDLERAAALRYLEEICRWLEQQGVKARATILLGGPIANDILNLARPGQVSLLALATHGRGGIGRLTLGSVADKLVRGADVPVLVVRPKAQGRLKPEPTSAQRLEQPVEAGTSQSNQF